LEKAIITEIEAFILEFGNGFSFVVRQKRMTMDGDDFTLDFRKILALNETSDELRMAMGRYAEHEKVYNEQGFTTENQNELVMLLERKIEYLANSFEQDKSYSKRTQQATKNVLEYKYGISEKI